MIPATLALALLACGGPKPEPAPTWVDVHEALDVPPPPGQVSLDLGPAAWPPELQPGASWQLAGVPLEVLDRRADPRGATLTVYAPDRRPVTDWIGAGRVQWAR